MKYQLKIHVPQCRWNQVEDQVNVAKVPWTARPC